MVRINHFGARDSSSGGAFPPAAELRPTPQHVVHAQIRAVLLGWLLTSLVGAGCLLAGEKGIVMGTVADPSPSPIPGVRVTLAAADGSRQTVVADLKGCYSFPSVEPGTYTLSAEASGYQAMTQAAIPVAGGTSITVDFHLTPITLPGPVHVPPALPEPSYYDDNTFKASAVKTTIDAAGYSSQAQSPQRLLNEGPSLSGSPSKIPVRVPGSPDALRMERELQEALRRDPGSFDANHQLGEYYRSVGDLKTGISYLEEAHRLKPDDDANGYDLAGAYLEAKSPGPARFLLHEMLRQKDTAEIHHLLGQAEEALGDPTSGIRDFRLAADLDPSENDLFDWGNALLLHDSLEPAIEVLKRGVALYPNSQRMYIDLGIAHYSRNLYDGAIEAICHASDLNPADPRPYMFLSKMNNVSVVKAREVTKRMKRFTETNPGNARAYYYYALSSWKGTRGGGEGTVDLAEVEALLRKSISVDPRLGDAHLQLGILLQDLHRDQEALPEFKAAVQFNPDEPEAHYRLAQAYVHAGNKERGQEELVLYHKLQMQQASGTEKHQRETPQLPFTQRDGPSTKP